VRLLLIPLFVCGSLAAQTLSFAIHDPSGTQPDTALSSTYQFPDTPQDSASSIVINAKNISTSTVLVAQVYVGSAAGSAVVSPDFSITGLNQNATLAPGNSLQFTLNFRPSITGSLLGYLQAAYAVQQNGCVIGSSTPGTQCTGTIAAVSTLQGTSTTPQFVLSYNPGTGSVALQPSGASRLDFGNVSTSATASYMFTLTNQSTATLSTPAISLQTQVFASSAFALDISAVPSTITAGASATFTVTFAPGQTGLTTATLAVGSNQYPIQGTGVVLTDIDALQISYVDATGVRGLPQAATPINFGQVVPGANTSAVLKFTVTNPTTSFNTVTLQTLTISGSAFVLSGAPGMPAIIQPGASIAFQITFSAASSGTYTGTLAIGSRSFSLTGLSVVSPLPSFSFQLSKQPLTSQQQVNLNIQFASAPTASAIGTLSMSFVPSVANVSDDPAIVFPVTNGRQLQVNVAPGSQNATYNGQSAITFQTGTTAGTITFTLTFPNTAPFSQSYSISPAQVQITSATAVRQSPNLVVTVNGFDNTYGTGQMSFIFYDTSGKVLMPNGIAVDSRSKFHQYFFTNNQAGGAFAMQASFPVSGDATQVGSVAVTMNNSVGQTNTTLTFQ
jgi:hypothetical protein